MEGYIYMKEWMIVVVVMTIILVIVLFPRKATYTHVNHEKTEIESFDVTIEGAVVFPGTYKLHEEMKLAEILSFCQGLRDDADISKLDFYRVYQKNSLIFIPSLEELSLTPIVKININEANFQTLLKIPGMTEDRAASLLVYRQANGHFSTLEELINVKHIGPATLEKIKPYITLG